MNEVNKTMSLKDLTDDVLCALVARHAIRKLGFTPLTNSGLFSDVFHEYSDIQKHTDEKKAKKLETERRKKLDQYLLQNLIVNDIDGNPTLVIID